jgi:hypothetical protein
MECNNLDIETAMKGIKNDIWELQIFEEIFKNPKCVIPDSENIAEDFENRIIKLAKAYMNLAGKRADNEKGGKRRACTLAGGSNCMKCIECEL